MSNKIYKQKGGNKLNNKNEFLNWKFILPLFIGLLLIILVPLYYNYNKEDQKKLDNQSSQENKKQENAPKYLWGVDSASKTTKEMYKCVNENFGKPKVWGRYIGTNEEVSTGLTQQEIKLLHEKKIKILLIYNHFSNATTQKAGQQEAKKAIKYAKELRVPKDTLLFADIEPNYPVDSAFIKGWVETLNKSDYLPGIYGVFDKNQKLFSAFNKAGNDVKEKAIIWSAAPNMNITSKEKAPKYNPTGPKESKILGWQYGIDAKKCNIDTNLFKGEIEKNLW